MSRVFFLLPILALFFLAHALRWAVNNQERKMLYLLVATIFLGQPARALEPIAPLTVEVAPQDIFLPVGFDGNDNTQIVVAGEFPNTCYQSGKLIAEVKGNRISLRQEARLHTSCWCAPIAVPYSQTVDLGILPIGNYTVQSAGLKAGVLTVARPRSSAPDDFFYAPVEEVVLDAGGARPTLTLRGTYPSDCMRIREIKVVEKNNVVVVLPITDLREGTACAPRPVPFEETVVLERRARKTLVHIRSLNGQAINKVMAP
jgi:hypothetical protein